MNGSIKSVVALAALTVGLAACSGGPEAPAGGGPADAHSSAAAAQAAPVAQGAVQRDYPSASEEAAMKLDYPLFLAYGPDSARITAFFPGASTRPVSVKLAPNEPGYGLTSEGTECAFPIDYALKSADGQELASGEYKGGAVTLAGWGADKGVAVLSLHMSDSAKNNFGCNIVVKKK